MACSHPWSTKPILSYFGLRFPDVVLSNISNHKTGLEGKRMGLAAMLDHDLQYAFSCAARQATARELRRMSRRSKHDAAL